MPDTTVEASPVRIEGRRIRARCKTAKAGDDETEKKKLLHGESPESGKKLRSQLAAGTL
ncbi:hypothetical protein AB4120_12355 [Cupriavidus sp. 2KB_3]|uniref:hypothetical protein n=1 Tax=Cupriavidus TaxID=106589 RepID=UPI0016568752|nr:hypothetical protein [Cupriavidus campinensis]